MDWRDEAKYGQAALQQANMLSPVRETKRQRLEGSKKALENQLKTINAALAALDEHPELENFIEVLERAGF